MPGRGCRADAVKGSMGSGCDAVVSTRWRWGPQKRSQGGASDLSGRGRGGAVLLDLPAGGRLGQLGGNIRGCGQQVTVPGSSSRRGTALGKQSHSFTTFQFLDGATEPGGRWGGRARLPVGVHRWGWETRLAGVGL